MRHIAEVRTCNIVPPAQDTSWSRFVQIACNFRNLFLWNGKLGIGRKHTLQKICVVEWLSWRIWNLYFEMCVSCLLQASYSDSKTSLKHHYLHQ